MNFLLLWFNLFSVFICFFSCSVHWILLINLHYLSLLLLLCILSIDDLTSITSTITVCNWDGRWMYNCIPNLLCALKFPIAYQTFSPMNPCTPLNINIYTVHCLPSQIGPLFLLRTLSTTCSLWAKPWKIFTVFFSQHFCLTSISRFQPLLSVYIHAHFPS